MFEEIVNQSKCKKREIRRGLTLQFVSCVLPLRPYIAFISKRSLECSVI